MVNINDEFPSKYLKSADLQGQALRVKIADVKPEQLGGDRKLLMSFAGRSKSMILNKTNSKTLADAFGDETDNWIGADIEVFSMRVMDPHCRMVDGLRVRVPPMRKPDASVNVAMNEPNPPASAYEDLDDQSPDEDPFAREIRG